MSELYLPPYSGVVLYPETENVGINPALARQFGMAVNAYVVGGEVHTGTAFAVSYDPQLAVDLEALHHATRSSSPDEANAEARTVLAEFDRYITHVLRESGVPAEELNDVLAGRRLDVIGPADISQHGVEMLVRHLPYISKRPAGRPAPQVWRHTESGVLVAANDLPVGHYHPLGKMELGTESDSVTRHAVYTAGVLLKSYVQQEVVYETPPTDPQLVNTTSGYQHTVTSQTSATHKATFDIPLPQDRTLINELDRLDLANQRAQLAHNRGGEEPDGDIDSTWSDDNGPYVPYVDTTEARRRSIARLLDPYENPAWRARLR